MTVHLICGTDRAKTTGLRDRHRRRQEKALIVKDQTRPIASRLRPRKDATKKNASKTQNAIRKVSAAHRALQTFDTNALNQGQRLTSKVGVFAKGVSSCSVKIGRGVAGVPFRESEFLDGQLCGNDDVRGDELSADEQRVKQAQARRKDDTRYRLCHQSTGDDARQRKKRTRTIQDDDVRASDEEQEVCSRDSFVADSESDMHSAYSLAQRRARKRKQDDEEALIKIARAKPSVASRAPVQKSQEGQRKSSTHPHGQKEGTRRTNHANRLLETQEVSVAASAGGSDVPYPASTQWRGSAWTAAAHSATPSAGTATQLRPDAAGCQGQENISVVTTSTGIDKALLSNGWRLRHTRRKVPQPALAKDNDSKNHMKIDSEIGRYNCGLPPRQRLNVKVSPAESDVPQDAARVSSPRKRTSDGARQRTPDSVLNALPEVISGIADIDEAIEATPQIATVAAAEAVKIGQMATDVAHIFGQPVSPKLLAPTHDDNIASDKNLRCLQGSMPNDVMNKGQEQQASKTLETSESVLQALQTSAPIGGLVIRPALPDSNLQRAGSNLTNATATTFYSCDELDVIGDLGCTDEREIRPRFCGRQSPLTAAKRLLAPPTCVLSRAPSAPSDSTDPLSLPWKGSHTRTEEVVHGSSIEAPDKTNRCPAQKSLLQDALSHALEQALVSKPVWLASSNEAQAAEPVNSQEGSAYDVAKMLSSAPMACDPCHFWMPQSSTVVAATHR